MAAGAELDLTPAKLPDILVSDSYYLSISEKQSTCFKLQSSTIREDGNKSVFIGGEKSQDTI